MVYFECQKCNETVKKPKLEKHLQMCSSWYVSCIDCSKVFAWNEWQSHTNCVSEAQKYQGKLFEAKENTNKGQAKQDMWTDNIQQKIEDPSSGVSAEIKGLLQKLLGFNNIPRKQKPFGNFVKNSVKIWDEKKISAMWEVIASCQAKPAAGGPNNQAAKPDANQAAKPDEAKPAATPAVCLPYGASKWKGWKRALDEELQAAPCNELPWKRLRDALAQKYRSEVAADEADDEVECAALASIPVAYLSKADELVRLPAKA